MKIKVTPTKLHEVVILYMDTMEIYIEKIKSSGDGPSKYLFLDNPNKLTSRGRVLMRYTPLFHTLEIDRSFYKAVNKLFDLDFEALSEIIASWVISKLPSGFTISKIELRFLP